MACLSCDTSDLSTSIQQIQCCIGDITYKLTNFQQLGLQKEIPCLEYKVQYLRLALGLVQRYNISNIDPNYITSSSIEQVLENIKNICGTKITQRITFNNETTSYLLEENLGRILQETESKIYL